ncbi:unnamed protein product [Rhizoctonia solani]|uniref:Peptidase C14 caspase domain-containing protein n=1 Tax=Rhizoctonia solani TaxID=456999 RepID=A0A8H3CSU8_9AGAM|nr:unnamed protein product [Rhizoctonia solani]
MAPALEPGTYMPDREDESLARGKGDPPVSQAAPAPAPVSDEILSELDAAIQKGDQPSNGSNPTSTKRRALVVAAQYFSDERTINRLPGTANDALKIYKMLLKSGYQETDIRILCEGFDDDNSPTKKNITSSLDWLVYGARSGDYRYFHFSGHGEAFKSTRKEGKEARIIPGGEVKRKLDDTEVVPLNTLHTDKEGNVADKPSQRIRSQTIASNELTYYSEAILTSWKAPGWIQRRYLKFQFDNLNRIRDKELNAVFALLPPGCTLTTSLDRKDDQYVHASFHKPKCGKNSRFVPDSNFKLAGDGFRGSSSGSVAASEEVATQPATECISCAPKDRKTWFIPNLFSLETFTSADDTEDLREMKEALPEQERALDGIKANVISWSGCHQRQNAREFRNQAGGYFTSAFTKAIEEGPRDLKLQEMHAKVDKYLHQIIRDTHEDNKMLQYCQIWTSLGGGGESQAEEKLEHPFEI